MPLKAFFQPEGGHSRAKAHRNTASAEKRRIAWGFKQTLFTKVLMVLLRIGRNAILARVLGPADRGLFSLICSLPEIIMTIGNAGLSNAAAYHTVKQAQSGRQVIANTNTQLLILSVLLIVVTLFFLQAHWLPSQYSEAMDSFGWVIIIAIPMMLFKAVNTTLLSALQRITSVNVAGLAESLLPLFIFLLFWCGLNIDALLAAVYAWIMALSLLAILTFIQLKLPLKLRFNHTIQRDLLSFGYRGYFDTLFQKLLLRIDFIFVSYLVGHEALGYYAIATAAAELLLIIPNALSVPLFSFFMKQSPQIKNSVTPFILRLLSTTIILTTVFFAIFGKTFINILFGAEYLPAYTTLLYLLPGVACLCYASILRIDLLSYNRPGLISIISGFAVIINILLNFALIPKFGFNGAALAASSAYGLAAFFLAIAYHNVAGTNILTTLFITTKDCHHLISTLKRSVSLQ